MTKKDFNALAAAIKATGASFLPDGPARAAVRRTAEAIAGVCAASNSRFDRARFLVACGFGGE